MLREKLTAVRHSCLYEGTVVHKRLKPFVHTFRYKLCWLYLDLNELDDVFRGRWLWSTSRPAAAWFRRDDHLGDPAEPLAESVRRLVETRTGRRPTGPIRLLTHPRYFGYVINPISVYYCFDSSGERLETCVAEVTNTPWGERHCYVVPVTDGADSRVPVRSSKELHVSPFQPMDMEYHWTITAPTDRLTLGIENRDADGRAFSAGMTLSRRPLNTHQLSRLLIRYPLLTTKILAAIYWQAVKLWWKGATFHPHPRHSDSVGHSKTAAVVPTQSPSNL